MAVSSLKDITQSNRSKIKFKLSIYKLHDYTKKEAENEVVRVK